MSTELRTSTLDTVDAPTGMSAIARRIKTSVYNFCKEEDGLSTVEMLLLLFIGLVIVIAIIKFIFPNVWNVIKNQINNLLGYGNNQTT